MEHTAPFHISDPVYAVYNPSLTYNVTLWHISVPFFISDDNVIS